MTKRLNDKKAYSILEALVKMKIKAHSCSISKAMMFDNCTSINISVEYDDGKGFMSSLMCKSKGSCISTIFTIEHKNASWLEILHTIEKMAKSGNSFYFGSALSSNLVFDAYQTIEEILICMDLSI